MSNWRLIEAELVSALELQDVPISESHCGDKMVNRFDINITLLAQSLADRLSPIARPVQVKAGVECKVSQP